MRRSRAIKQFLLDIFYPNRCPCCSKLIPWQDTLCESCRVSMQKPEEGFCTCCGKLPVDCLCGTGLSYDRAVVLTEYEGAARSGILSMKTAESMNFVYACGELLAEEILADEALMGYDLLIPVPMSKRKKRKRMWNPPEKTAYEISMRTNIPMRTDILTDNGMGKTQHSLSAKERADNTDHFSICDVDLNGYRILLCDDVLTTGSTMNRCAALLKEKGAAEVTAVVIASTGWKRK